MKIALAIGIGLLVLATKAAAITIYECEDEDGNRGFEQSCPPGTTQVTEKHYRSGSGGTEQDMDDVAAAAPVVLYTAPACDACDVVRSFIQQRGIPFTEKDVSDDVDMQEELLGKTGQLSVPVTLIGEQAVMGYNRSVLETELRAAGYPDAATGAAAQPTP